MTFNPVKSHDVMIDIETLGTERNSIILTIGAIKFDRVNDSFNEEFYKRVSIDSCKQYGMTFDKSTMDWWNKQSKEVRDEAFYATPREDILTVLKALSVFIGEGNKVWSHGSCFDIVMLEDIYKKCKLPVPWKFWNIRDTRTLYDVGDVSLVADKNTHNALYDCRNQIKGVRDALKKVLTRD
jgi:hypothetical protein